MIPAKDIYELGRSSYLKRIPPNANPYVPAEPLTTRMLRLRLWERGWNAAHDADHGHH